MDLSYISLDILYELTRHRKLSAGRKVLLDSIEQRFKQLKEQGINNLQDLLYAMRDKSNLQQLVLKTGIPIHYLKVLKREACSYNPKPRKLSEFQGIPFEYVSILESRGIKYSNQLLQNTSTKEQILELSRILGIPVDRIDELISLSDLIRINGVDSFFARILFEAGIKSVKSFSEYEIKKILTLVEKILQKRNYTGPTPTMDDIQFCMHYAKFLVDFQE